MLKQTFCSFIPLFCIVIGVVLAADDYGAPGTAPTNANDQSASKSAFTNDPVMIPVSYHHPTAYEAHSYDFWYENWPQPHYHGDAPKPDERHQHYPSYNDNYDFNNFITDPPTQNGAKSEPVNEDHEQPLVDEPELPEPEEKQRDYGVPTSEPLPIVNEKLTKPVDTLPPKSGYEPGPPQSNHQLVPSGYTSPGIDSASNSEILLLAPAPFESDYRNGGNVLPPSTSSSIGISAGRYDGPSPPAPQVEVVPGSADNGEFGDDSVPEDPYESTKSIDIPATPYEGNQGIVPPPARSTASAPAPALSVAPAPALSVAPAQSPAANLAPPPEPRIAPSPIIAPPEAPAPPSNVAPPPAPSVAPPPAPIYSQSPEDEFYKSPPGVQPELYPETKTVATQEPYVPAAPAPSTNVGNFFPEEEAPIVPQRPQIVRPTLTQIPETDSDLVPDTGLRPCCPCCRNSHPDFPPRGPTLGEGGCGGGGGIAPTSGCGGGCGSNVLCGAPPIVGTPPQCCPTAPLPCCPRLPTCCLPQLPCCPKIQIPCCPPIQICCQPLNFGGCGGGCRSKAVMRVRSKRFGCLPCIGRKKRDTDADAEEPHIRQKRLNCVPCLARNKRQAASNCQRCNPLMQHVVSRVKRSFSCTTCATHKERVKRQTDISDFYRANALGTNRNCQVCNTLPLPHVMKKRSITPAQNDFLARVKRSQDTAYDPLFKCDAGCCDYTKCIRSKPLRETFKIPQDTDFVEKPGDYDLPDLKSEETDNGDSFRRKSARN